MCVAYIIWQVTFIDWKGGWLKNTVKDMFVSLSVQYRIVLQNGSVSL